MNLETRFQIKNPEVIHEMIENEVIVVNLDSGTYYTIDASGGRIWNLIHSGDTIQGIIDKLVHEFEGTQSEIEDGLFKFISQLEEEKLIHERNSAPAEKTHIVPNPKLEKLPFGIPTLSKYTDMQDLLLLDPIHEVDDTGWPKVAAGQHD